MNLIELPIENELPLDLDAPCMSRGDYVRYGEELTRLKGLYKSIQEQRMEQTRPLDESKKKIMAFFEKPLGVIKDAIDRRLMQMLAYQKKEEAAAAELQAKAAVEGQVAIVSAPKAAGISTRDVWKWKVVDAKLIPREFLAPDESKISAWVRNAKGSTEIPGIEVFKTETTVIKAN